PYGTDYLDENLQGLIHLNGPQALSYCRNRYIGTDFGRTERQRKVLGAMVKRAPWVLLHIDKVPAVFENVTTNLTQAECTWLSGQIGKIVSYDMVQGSIPLDGTYSNATIRGMAVLSVDFEANNQYIREEIYGQGIE
ncbi:MAG: LCP family protein, partial [Lachnospiraceae bacterium]|nr:LCP family protein [Lachnospiraceae bacterium]